jgi:hypothetical protein
MDNRKGYKLKALLENQRVKVRKKERFICITEFYGKLHKKGKWRVSHQLELHVQTIHIVRKEEKTEKAFVSGAMLIHI